MDVLKLSISPIGYTLESQMEMIDEPYEIDLQMDEYVAQRDGGYSWKKHKALASGLMHRGLDLASLYNERGHADNVEAISMNVNVINYIANELNKIGVSFDRGAFEDFIRTL